MGVEQQQGMVACAVLETMAAGYTSFKADTGRISGVGDNPPRHIEN